MVNKDVAIHTSSLLILVFNGGNEQVQCIEI